MPWSPEQIKRLKMERTILQKYFPSFTWIDQKNNKNTKIEGDLKTSLGNIYKIRVYVPSDFPYSKPGLAVLYPYPLKGYNNRNIGYYQSLFNWSDMHLDKNRDGYPQICHYRNWSPEITLYKVILKGRIWLEALEGHKRTGQPISHFLSEMKPN